MADTSSFEIESLKRGWIEGITGDALSGRVLMHCAQIEALSSRDYARGVVVAENDPIEFAVQFFAALSLKVPIVLANPNWGELERAELDALLANADPQPGSILIPTGGSTGGVKLAIHTWQSLVAASRGVQDFLGGGLINSCCVLPLYHVSGLMQLIRSLVSGGRIRFDEAEIAGCCLSYVPTQLQRALKNPQRIQKLVTARAIFVGGGALAESIAERARLMKLPVVPVYGMTETAAMVAAISNDAFLKNPKAGAETLGGAIVRVEESGAIRIQSPALFQGYHGHLPIDLTDGYLTDDEGRIDEFGHLHVIGRVDRLINSGGEKVDPLEVEAAIRKHLGLSEVLVCGDADEEWGQRLVALYILREQEILPDAWQSLLKSHIAKFKIPKQMIAVETLPLNGRGKIDRLAIKELIKSER